MTNSTRPPTGSGRRSGKADGMAAKLPFTEDDLKAVACRSS